MDARELGNGLGNALALQKDDVRGEVIFMKPGTHYWTVPKNVKSISIVCVGGGGGAFTNLTGYDVSSGGGGGLSWSNREVAEGTILTVRVGYGGRGAGNSQYSNQTNGDASYVKIDRTTLCIAYGGYCGTLGVAGTGGIGGIFSDGGGYGGNGAYNTSTAPGAVASGGGAGGYSGSGGDGVTSRSEKSLNGNPGSGGAGGSGGICAGSTYAGCVGGSGGVGIFGEGLSGSGGTANLNSGSPYAYGGRAGSDGVDGGYSAHVVGVAIGKSGMFGGGGGCLAITTGSGVPSYAADGADGVVRIIWGKGRAFPSTDCGQS